MTRGYLGWGYFGLGLFWHGVILVWGYFGLGLFWFGVIMVWGYFGGVISVGLFRFGVISYWSQKILLSINFSLRILGFQILVKHNVSIGDVALTLYSSSEFFENN